MEKLHGDNQLDQIEAPVESTGQDLADQGLDGQPPLTGCTRVSLLTG